MIALMMTLGMACDDGSANKDAGKEPAPPSEYGPDNQWWHATTADVPDGLAGTGSRTGDIAENFTLTDQHGDTVELYQFYGQVIVLDVFAAWCGPCQEMAPEGEALWQAFRDDGVVYLSVMVEGNTGPADTSDIQAWADAYGLSHPVVADPEATQDGYARIGYPTVVLIDREMRIDNEDVWPLNDQAVRDLL